MNAPGKFSKDHVIILPHAEEYRDAHTLTLDALVRTLNEPDVSDCLTQDKYTAEKTIGKKRVYVYYYQTLPLQATQGGLYAIVDFVGVSDA